MSSALSSTKSCRSYFHYSGEWHLHRETICPLGPKSTDSDKQAFLNLKAKAACLGGPDGGGPAKVQLIQLLPGTCHERSSHNTREKESAEVPKKWQVNQTKSLILTNTPPVTKAKQTKYNKLLTQIQHNWLCTGDAHFVMSTALPLVNYLSTRLKLSVRRNFQSFITTMHKIVVFPF